MTRDRSLEGQYALVTGASRGIGRAIAECFAQAGCSVVLTARGDVISGVAQDVGEKWGVPSLGVSADVSERESVHELFESIRSWSGNRFKSWPYLRLSYLESR